VSARRVAWLLVVGLAVIAFAVWLSSRRHLERDMAAGAQKKAARGDIIAK